MDDLGRFLLRDTGQRLSSIKSGAPLFQLKRLASEDLLQFVSTGEQQPAMRRLVEQRIGQDERGAEQHRIERRESIFVPRPRTDPQQAELRQGEKREDGEDAEIPAHPLAVLGELEPGADDGNDDEADENGKAQPPSLRSQKSPPQPLIATLLER